MAAPTPSVRQSPGGIWLREGHPSKVTFSRDPDISFWERSSNPPSQDGGDAIEHISSHNVRYVIKRPRTLVRSDDITIVGSYDAAVYNQILDMLNVEQTITHTWSDGSTVAYFGFVRKAEYNDGNAEGEEPTVTVTITPSHWDYVNRVEAGPALASVAGT